MSIINVTILLSLILIFPAAHHASTIIKRQCVHYQRICFVALIVICTLLFQLSNFVQIISATNESLLPITNCTSRSTQP